MLISATDIQQAAERLQPYLTPTPTIRSDYYSQRTGANIYLKLDIFQPTHSFKVRGALNTLLALPVEQRQKGVITASQGNHGLGVIYAAQQLGIKAAVYLGKGTPEVRVKALEATGAEVVLYGDSWDEANHYAMELAAKEGKAYIHPFNDVNVMAGQGTVFMEMLAQVPQIDAVIVSIGGGGLISGVISAAEAFSPTTDVYGVETIGADSMYQSVQEGMVVELPAITSIATSLGARKTEITQLGIVYEYAMGVVTVTDEQAVASLLTLLDEEKLLVEPAASCTLAAITEGKIAVKAGSNVAVLMCGANVTLESVLGWRKGR